MKEPLLPIALLLPLAAAACSDFATAPERVPAAFGITPDSVLLTEGETVSFEYTLLDESGEPYGTLPAWASPLWGFSRDSVLEVDPTGVGRALGPGRAEGTARVAGLEADAVVRVNPAEMEVSVAFAYITQSTQVPRGGVPLVTGRDGLLRVYLRGDKPNFFTPRVRATFQRRGSVVHTAVLELEEVGLPRDLNEGDLNLSFDAIIPASVLQPGTGMVIEVDPEGVLPASSSSVLRVPETGVLALDIVDLPPFRVRLVPVDQSRNGLRSRFTEENAMDRLQDTWDMFPIGELDVDVRLPYTTGADLTTVNGWDQLIYEIKALREDEGSGRYYYGGFQLPQGSNFAGYGFIGYPTSIGTDASAGTLAHELGHNLSLYHAPCGGPANVDPYYPYPRGVIGRFGYSLREARLLPTDRYDLMSYCDPVWISDYHYEKVVEFRARTEMGAAAASAAEEEVVFINVVVREGAIGISPVIPLRTSPTREPDDGRYTLTGLDAGGAPLFTWRFDPEPLDHGHSAMFTAAIPVAVAQPERLATLRVTGPGGVVERRRSPGGVPPIVVLDDTGPMGATVVRWDAASYPLAVIRDGATGQIVALPRGGEFRLPAAQGSVDVTLSDGVRGHPAQLRQE